MAPQSLMTLRLLLLGLLCGTALGAPTRKLLQAGGSGGSFPDPSLADSFVRVEGQRFVLGCREFPISGWNQWEVMEAGAGAPQLVGSTLPPGVKGPQLVTQVLDLAARNGLTVMRAWAHGVSPNYAVLLAPGKYNEGMLRGLDFALDEARKRGIKVILSFTSNWASSGGVDDLANFTGTTHNGFFTNSATKELFKSYMGSIINRKNTINGLAYKDDATIMAWDLINEPVCRDCGQGTIANWAKEMAGYVKGQDPNHLLTVGEEGFYSTTSSKQPSNPMYAESGWAAEWTQDSVKDHKDSNIDFIAFHAWPDLWKCQGCSQALPVDFLRKWIQSHQDDGAQLGKPVLLEEFGKEAGGDRDSYFQAAYEAVEASLKSGGALRGALFWQLYAPGQTASKGEGGGAGKFGVYEGSSTFNLVKANAGAAAQLASGAVSQCSPKGPAASRGSCSKGWEGPDCSIDINECARGSAGCAATAVCTNTQGGFDCQCPVGTNGDPHSSCSNDTAKLNAAVGGYYNDPKGQACDKGRDVKYPQDAAGWVEDPMGYYERNPAFTGGFGARAPVTLGQCAVACDAASECEEFTFNTVQGGCFLKAGMCPLRNNCQGPEVVCQSTSDTGQNISVPCGTWSTWYKHSIWDNRQALCSGSGQVAAYSGGSGAGR